MAAVGCHTDSAVWAHWRKLIAETSSIPLHDHSLEEIARVFAVAGFTVGSTYFPKITDQLRYYTVDKVVFRFVHPSL